jgi:hypothetical protein
MGQIRTLSNGFRTAGLPPMADTVGGERILVQAASALPGDDYRELLVCRTLSSFGVIEHLLNLRRHRTPDLDIVHRLK